MAKTPNNRSWKNFLIRLDVQLPIMAANLIFLAIVAAGLIAALLSPLYHDMIYSQDLWAQNVSGNLLLILIRRIALAMLLILILTMAHQIFLSHRFCGPLVNFGHTFNKMTQGDFSRKVYLRKNDFLKAEAAQVNAILDRLNSDRQILKDHLDQMASAVAQLEKQHLVPETATLIHTLRASVDASHTTLAT